MPELNELIQTADWKKEKHVPTIDCPDRVTAGELFEVRASLGKEIAHPNTTEHHIRWIDLYFLPEGGKLAIQLGHFQFTAHGESPAGSNEGPVYTHHDVTAAVKTTKPGTIQAMAYCNIHGLWEASKQITLA